MGDLRLRNDDQAQQARLHRLVEAGLLDPDFPRTNHKKTRNSNFESRSKTNQISMCRFRGMVHAFAGDC